MLPFTFASRCFAFWEVLATLFTVEVLLNLKIPIYLSATVLPPCMITVQSFYSTVYMKQYKSNCILQYNCYCAVTISQWMVNAVQRLYTCRLGKKDCLMSRSNKQIFCSKKFLTWGADRGSLAVFAHRHIMKLEQEDSYFGQLWKVLKIDIESEISRIM